MKEQCPVLAGSLSQLGGASGRMQIWKIVPPICFSGRKDCRKMLIRHPFIVSLTMESRSTSSPFACHSGQNRGRQVIIRRIQECTMGGYPTLRGCRGIGVKMQWWRLWLRYYLVCAILLPLFILNNIYLRCVALRTTSHPKCFLCCCHCLS